MLMSLILVASGLAGSSRGRPAGRHNCRHSAGAPFVRRLPPRRWALPQRRQPLPRPGAPRRRSGEARETLLQAVQIPRPSPLVRRRLSASRRQYLRSRHDPRPLLCQDHRDIPRPSRHRRAAPRQARPGTKPGTGITVRPPARPAFTAITHCNGGGRGIRTPDTACHRITV